jgi:sulfatase maturation enzyme AslB (radical SAM superfamily)
MLAKGKRLQALQAVQHPDLTIQVSLDGAQAEQHDAYRGAGSWVQTVEGIRRLQESGFRVRVSTTETGANREHLEEICQFHQSLGIPETEHFLRPLARRGFSMEGMELSTENMEPEVTVDMDGVYWHPLSTDSDMRVSWKIFPLAEAVECIREQLQSQTPRQSFT